MFRPTSPQRSLLEVEFLVPPEKAERMARSWGTPFRDLVLPLIDEEQFRDAFHADNGRPNKSIRLLMGLHILRDWHDLTDAQVVEALEFNLLWQYALAVEPSEAHVSARTLWSFRELLKRNDRAARAFETVTRGLAAADGLRLGQQRLDSTHIVPNIAILSRLGLFVETTAAFLTELRRELPDILADLPGVFARRYLDREGYFSDAKRSQARRRLEACAQDVFTLVRRFEAHREVGALQSFATLRRLFEEQCVVVDDDGPEGGTHAEDDDAVDDGVDDAMDDAGPLEVGPERGRTRSATPGEGHSQRALPREPSDDAADTDEAAEGESSRPAGLGEPTGAPSLGGDEAPGEPVSERAALRDPKEMSGATLQSPHDTDATYGHKGKGYELQVSETYDPENAYQIITGVALNGANESDQHAVAPMLAQLDEARMKPFVLLADTGYGSGANIVHAAEQDVELIAPVRDPKAPEKADRFIAAGEPEGASDATAATPEAVEVVGIEDFILYTTCDQVMCCPRGHEPLTQHLANGILIATFGAADCQACPFAASCPTRALKSGDRQLRQGPAAIATAIRQVEQQQAQFKERYRPRSGIESTNNELKHAHGLAHLRVRGRLQVALAAITKALALNVKRAMRHHVERLRQALPMAAGAA